MELHPADGESAYPRITVNRHISEPPDIERGMFNRLGAGSHNPGSMDGISSMTFGAIEDTVEHRPRAPTLPRESTILSR